MSLHSALVWLVRIVVTLAVLLIVFSSAAGRLVEVYRHHFADTHRERMFLASFAFFLTFGIVRVLTHVIHRGRGPFHDVVVGGLHIHHMVWGICLLLLLGYLWILQVGTGLPGTSAWASRGMSLAFGVAAALTLDEFALWFNLRDVYWLPQGRESIDAVLLFGSLLTAAFWGGPFVRALVGESLRALQR